MKSMQPKEKAKMLARPSHIDFVILTLVLTLSVAGCDAEDAPILSHGSSLVGTSWQGQLTSRNGQSLTSVPISLMFSSDSLFQASNLTNENSQAKGRYRDMPLHGSIMLEVTESSFPEFANEGSFMSFDYSTQDQELMIKSDQIEFRLVKNPEVETFQDNPLQGSWSCQETRNARWQIDVSGNRFWARRAVTGRRALRLEGNVAYREPDRGKEVTKAVLKVTHATEQSLIGANLGFSVKASKVRLLEELDQNEASLADGLSIECQHE